MLEKKFSKPYFGFCRRFSWFCTYQLNATGTRLYEWKIVISLSIACIYVYNLDAAIINRVFIVTARRQIKSIAGEVRVSPNRIFNFHLSPDLCARA